MTIQLEKAIALETTSASLTHVGHVRKINEDCLYENRKKGIWAVADGMGGYAAGDIASRILINAIMDVDPASTLEISVERVESAIQIANKKLLNELTLPTDCKQIGTTIVVLIYCSAENRCACLWVGDSRLYAFRRNQIYQLTKDHSVVQEMVDRGVLDNRLRDSHPQSHVITRAVGVVENLKVDVVIFDPEAGDAYLLCSDGLYNEVSSEQMMEHASELEYPFVTISAEKWCQQLTQNLLKSVLSSTATDNVSINVVAMV